MKKRKNKLNLFLINYLAVSLMNLFYIIPFNFFICKKKKDYFQENSKMLLKIV